MEHFLQFFWPDLVIIGSITATTCTMTWWLSDQFLRGREMTISLLKAHEAKDQERYEQILARFEAISVKIARYGTDGG